MHTGCTAGSGGAAARELPLQLALRLQKFHPQAFRRGDEARFIAGINGVRSLDER
jgi:hypothetical protein